MSNNCPNVPGFRLKKNNKGNCVPNIEMERLIPGNASSKSPQLNNNRKYINRISSTLNTEIKENIELKSESGPKISQNLPPKSCLMLTCKNIYTGPSNFLNFLSFLNYYGKLNKNIYVVSHSHAMQSFLKKYNINDSGLSKQNLWSIVLKNMNNVNNVKSIIFTRHAFSIANVAKEKKRSIDQMTEKDSALSMYGILSSFNKKIDIKESIDTIYVSPLIRTWMTGTALYLKHCSVREFNIIISPYIIEDGGAFDNTPRQFSDQIEYFKIFLNILQKINDIKNTNESYTNKIINVFDGRSDQVCEFVYVENEWTNNNLIKTSYFIKHNNQSSTFDTTFYKLLPGVNKPNEDALTKISRWCEKLAMKGHFNYNNKKKMCSKRLSNN